MALTISHSSLMENQSAFPSGRHERQPGATLWSEELGIISKYSLPISPLYLASISLVTAWPVSGKYFPNVYFETQPLK